MSKPGFSKKPDFLLKKFFVKNFLREKKFCELRSSFPGGQNSKNFYRRARICLIDSGEPGPYGNGRINLRLYGLTFG